MRPGTRCGKSVERRAAARQKTAFIRQRQYARDRWPEENLRLGNVALSGVGWLVDRGRMLGFADLGAAGRSVARCAVAPVFFADDSSACHASGRTPCTLRHRSFFGFVGDCSAGPQPDRRGSVHINRRTGDGFRCDHRVSPGLCSAASGRLGGFVRRSCRHDPVAIGHVDNGTRTFQGPPVADVIASATGDAERAEQTDDAETD